MILDAKLGSDGVWRVPESTVQGKRADYILIDDIHAYDIPDPLRQRVEEHFRKAFVDLERQASFAFYGGVDWAKPDSDMTVISLVQKQKSPDSV